MKVPEEALRTIAKYNLIVGAAYVILSLVFWSLSKTVGLTLGAALITLNFSLMVYLVKKAFWGGKIHPVPFVLYLLKFVALVGLAFIILQWKWINKIFFLIGTTVILASLAITSIKYRNASEES